MEKRVFLQRRFSYLPAVRKESGIVLILALAVILILAVVAWEFTRAMLVEETVGNNYQDALSVTYMAKSGVYYAVSLLQKAGQEYRVYSEEWEEIIPPFSFGEGKVTVRIKDESGKLFAGEALKEENENGQKSRASIERLLTVTGIEVPDLSGFYQGVPYRSPGELLANSSVELEDYLTIFSDGKININTSGSEVLQSLSQGLDKDLAEAIISRRESKPFQSVEELRQVEGMSEEIFKEIQSRLTVTSSWYSIFSKSVFDDVRQAIKAVVRKEGKQVKVVYWRLEG